MGNIRVGKTSRIASGRNLRVRIAVESQEIDIRRPIAVVHIVQLTLRSHGKTWSVCIFIGVQKDIDAVVFVVTDE